MTSYYKSKLSQLAKRKDLVILLVILSLVILSNIIIFSVAYFYQNKSLTGTIQLGEVDFSIVETEHTKITVVPSSVLQKSIYIGNFRDNDPNNYKSLASIFFRFNFKVLLNDQVSEELTNLIDIYSEDKLFYDNNYYYFCGKLEAGKTANMCNSIFFDKTIDNKYQQQNIKLQFFVDAVQSANEAYKEVWQDYPTEWESIISST